jgi:hypothetical protein
MTHRTAMDGNGYNSSRPMIAVVRFAVHALIRSHRASKMQRPVIRVENPSKVRSSSPCDRLVVITLRTALAAF